MPFIRQEMYTWKGQQSAFDSGAYVGTVLLLGCVTIVLFLAAYFVTIKTCLAFACIAITTENLAVLIRPILHALTNFLVTRAGKHMHNRLPSGTHLWKLHAGIFLIIMFLIRTCFIWVFFEDLRWCRGQGKGTVGGLR